MNDLDDSIRKALSNDDAQMIGGPNDGLRIDQLVLSTFRSRNRLMTIPIVIVSLMVMGLSIWCLIQFFNATEIQAMLGWSMGVIVGSFMIGFMKVWFWMEMQRIAITREVKKVELLTARLLQEISVKSESI